MNYSTMPIWLMGALVFAALIAAREFGHLVRKRRKATTAADDAEDGFTMTSMLGLLALLIAFSFSISLQRYDARRELVISEANALGTTWLRTKLLDEADRNRLRAVLREYVDLRIEFGLATTAEEEAAAFRKTKAMQQQLWEATAEAVAPFRTTELASLLVTTTNESIDLAATRMAAREAHIPPRIILVLMLYALVASVMVGYEKGRYRTATSLLFFLLTLAASLVVDLDRPATGAIKVSQQPMLELQRNIAEHRAQATAAQRTLADEVKRE